MLVVESKSSQGLGQNEDDEVQVIRSMKIKTSEELMEEWGNSKGGKGVDRRGNDCQPLVTRLNSPGPAFERCQLHSKWLKVGVMKWKRKEEEEE